MLAGIFAGGKAKRMGGIDKGRLIAPDGRPILERTRAILAELAIETVLLGARPDWDGEILADDPGAQGPLAGLLALLERAHAHDHEHVMALACDMPFITRVMVQALLDAPSAVIVAPKQGAFWQPMFARYMVSAVLPIARAFADEGGTKLQLLLERAGAATLLVDDEGLCDWDSPDDVRRLTVPT